MSSIKCDACAVQLDFEVLVPSEVWERIAKGRYALCPRCIDVECAALGMKHVPCVAMYRGAALRSELAGEFRSAVLAFRPGPKCVARGTVGNPALFTGDKRG